MSAHANILLIDSDAAAGRELSNLLLDRPDLHAHFYLAGGHAGPASLATETIDWLFYPDQRVGQLPTCCRFDEISRASRRLSLGRGDKCTDHRVFPRRSSSGTLPSQPSHQVLEQAVSAGLLASSARLFSPDWSSLHSCPLLTI